MHVNAKFLVREEAKWQFIGRFWGESAGGTHQRECVSAAARARRAAGR